LEFEIYPFSVKIMLKMYQKNRLATGLRLDPLRERLSSLAQTHSRLLLRGERREGRKGRGGGKGRREREGRRERPQPHFLATPLVTLPTAYQWHWHHKDFAESRAVASPAMGHWSTCPLDSASLWICL